MFLKVFEVVFLVKVKRISNKILYKMRFFSKKFDFY